MTKKKSQSPRVRRIEQRAKQQRQRRIYYGLAALAVLMVAAIFFWVRQVNAPTLEDVVLPESLQPPSNADGKAWGPADAPVLIEEWSDFQ